MIRLLLALLRPMRSIAKSLVLISAALDRLAPPKAKAVQFDYLPFSEPEQDAETARREAYESAIGRSLGEDEDVPADYNPHELSSYIKHVFNRDRSS